MTTALADSKVPESIGISLRVWESIKQDFPRLVTPCAVSGNRKFYLSSDVIAALEANKLKLQNTKPTTASN